jgi:hypothetical protein
MLRSQPFRVFGHRRRGSPTDGGLTHGELREAAVVALAEYFDQLLGVENYGPADPDVIRAQQLAEALVGEFGADLDRLAELRVEGCRRLLAANWPPGGD